jgi:membrane-associated two-gene conflict system component 1 (EACC1)
MAREDGMASKEQLDLHLILEPAADRDPDQLDRLGRQLRTELRETDIESISAMEADEIPADAKGADVASLTELLITLSASGGVLTMVVQTLRDWLQRRDDVKKISLEIDGDRLELDAATAAERASLIQAYVHRHSRS